MSSSSSTTPVKARVSRAETPSRPEPPRWIKIITWVLFAVWVVLLSFAVVSLANPTWLQSLSHTGRIVDARDCQDWGDALLRTGKVEEAVQQYQRALKIKPDLATAQVNLAIAYEQLGESEQAETLLRRALTLPTGQKGVMYFHLADLYSKQKRTKEAEECFRLALNAKAPAGMIYRRLGVIYYSAGDFARAREQLELALAYQTDLTSPYREMLFSSLATYQDDSINRPIIEDLLARPLTDESMAMYDTTLLRWIQARDQEISGTHSDLGITLVQLGDTVGAIEHLRLAQDIWPENSRAHENLALLDRLRTGRRASLPN